MKSLNSYDSGNTVLVEQCQKISVDKLLETIKPQLKLQLLNAEIDDSL